MAIGQEYNNFKGDWKTSVWSPRNYRNTLKRVSSSSDKKRWFFFFFRNLCLGGSGTWRRFRASWKSKGCVCVEGNLFPYRGLNTAWLTGSAVDRAPDFKGLTPGFGPMFIRCSFNFPLAQNWKMKVLVLPCKQLDRTSSVSDVFISLLISLTSQHKNV